MFLVITVKPDGTMRHLRSYGEAADALAFAKSLRPAKGEKPSADEPEIHVIESLG